MGEIVQRALERPTAQAMGQAGGAAAMLSGFLAVTRVTCRARRPGPGSNGRHRAQPLRAGTNLKSIGESKVSMRSDAKSYREPYPCATEFKLCFRRRSLLELCEGRMSDLNGVTTMRGRTPPDRDGFIGMRQLRWCWRNCRMRSLALTAASPLYSTLWPNMVVPG